MGSLGPMEILVVLVAALVVLGPKRLPDAARQVGRALAELRRVSADLQAEVRDAFQEPTVVEPAPAQVPEATDEVVDLTDPRGPRPPDPTE